jgi:dolichyl-diphosphooligosaccharide--protein glycosyltransferase
MPANKSKSGGDGDAAAPASAAASVEESSSSSASSTLFNLTWVSALFYGLYFCVSWAYKIRLQAINEYGTVIHEFDPWFNFRATEVSSVSTLHE